MHLEKSGLPSRILVGYHIISILRHILTFIEIEYTIFVHDIVWTLLGSFEEITSVEGDEQITWHTENNKLVLQILLVTIFYYLLIGHLIIPQSNFTLPSHLSTAVSTSAGLPLAATTNLFVPVTSASVQPQGVCQSLFINSCIGVFL